MANAFSRLNNNRNQYTTQESTYKKLIVSEMNDIKELPEDNFPINLKSIDQYQQKEPTLMDKYQKYIYKTCYFCGGSNMDLNFITCADKIVILLILQTCILHWYYTYLPNQAMDRIEAMILQNIYWPSIRNAIWKEVTNFDTCQRKKWSNKNMVNYQIRKLRKHPGTNSV